MSDPRIDDLRRAGTIMLDPLTPAQVGEVLAFLKGRDVFNSRHVVQGDVDGFSSWEAAAASNVVAWRLGDAVLCPHLLERALAMTDFAAEYLGVATPYLYSMNVFCTRPGQPVRPDIQDWHRDGDEVDGDDLVEDRRPDVVAGAAVAHPELQGGPPGHRVDLVQEGGELRPHLHQRGQVVRGLVEAAMVVMPAPAWGIATRRDQRVDLLDSHWIKARLQPMIR